jgi:hypothetical protein
MQGLDIAIPISEKNALKGTAAPVSKEYAAKLVPTAGGAARD